MHSPSPVLSPGLHYDALAVAAFEGAPESLDTTVIPSSGPRTDMVMEVGAKLLGLAKLELVWNAFGRACKVVVKERFCWARTGRHCQPGMLDGPANGSLVCTTDASMPCFAHPRLQGARQLAAKAKAARQFTDTSNFTLR